MEDSEIVTLFFRRSETAVSACREKYGTLIRHIAYGILNNHEDSEECENDTYLRTWNSVPPTQPESLRAYLGRIVRNLAFNYIEKRNAAKRCVDTVFFSELEQMVPGGRMVNRTEGAGGDKWQASIAHNNVEEEVSVNELSECIAGWLRGLEAEERITFVRRYWYGDSVKEIAVSLGITAGKMASRLFRLREGLRAYLEEEGFYD